MARLSKSSSRPQFPNAAELESLISASGLSHAAFQCGRSSLTILMAASCERVNCLDKGSAPWWNERTFPFPMVVVRGTSMISLNVVSARLGRLTRYSNSCAALIILASSLCSAQTPSGLTIKGPVPWIDVTAYGATGDGSTDDHLAIQTAINACPSTAPYGCTVFFPLAKAGGNYRVTASLTIDTSRPGVILRGQCAAIGVGSSCSRLSTSTGTIYILQVGDTGLASAYQGLEVRDLGFNDTSGGGTVKGAIQLNVTEHFTLDSVYCSNFTTGVCLSPVGSSGAAVAQYGAIVNLNTSNTKFPVQTTGKTSSINLYGGDLQCNLASTSTPSIGLDIGQTNPNMTDHNGGEWGVFGTHILNCNTAIALGSSAAFQDYAILEQTSVSGCVTNCYAGTGTGVKITVPMSQNHTVGTIVSGALTSFLTGVSLGPGVDPITILSPFVNFGSGTKVGGDATAISKAIIMSTSLPEQFPSALTLGTPSINTGSLTMASASTPNSITLTPAAAAANRTYTVPDGGSSSTIGLTTGTLTNGDVAIFDGSGNLKDATVQASQGCQSSCRYVFGATDGSGFVVTGGRPVQTANNVNIAQFYNEATRKVGTGYTWVGTVSGGGHFDVGLYDSSGALKWHSGAQSTASPGGVVNFSPAAYTMNPGVYYLAYCADNTTAVLTAIVDLPGGSNASNFFGGTGTTANTFGVDSNSSDICSGNTLRSSITLSNISNSGQVEIAAVMLVN